MRFSVQNSFPEPINFALNHCEQFPTSIGTFAFDSLQVPLFDELDLVPDGVVSHYRKYNKDMCKCGEGDESCSQRWPGVRTIRLLDQSERSILQAWSTTRPLDQSERSMLLLQAWSTYNSSPRPNRALDASS